MIPNYSVLVFCGTKKACKKKAREIANKLRQQQTFWETKVMKLFVLTSKEE